MKNGLCTCIKESTLELDYKSIVGLFEKLSCKVDMTTKGEVHISVCPIVTL